MKTFEQEETEGQSYLENRKAAAGRVYWVYGPERSVITVIGLEPHPESAKSRGYERVKLSKMRPAKGENEKQ